MQYTAPTVTDLGTVTDLTQTVPGNKIGNVPDQYSATVPIIGSIVPAPGT